MPTEIYKFDATENTWRAITEIAYQDGATLRNITEVYYNDGGVWRQVFGGGVAPETLAWASATPSGIYSAIDLDGLPSQSIFSVDVLGNFLFQFLDVEAPGSTGTPLSGTYRPGLTGIDTSNYEISINASSVTGTGTRSAVGGADISGAYQDLNTTLGVQVENNSSGTTGEITVTVEIREKATPANTTGPATFTLKANGG